MRRTTTISLKELPNPNTRLHTALQRFSEGLNLADDPGRLRTGESPWMENLLVEGGCLRRRPGLLQRFSIPVETGPACFFERSWYDLTVLRLGRQLLYFSGEEAAQYRRICYSDGTPVDLPPAEGGDPAGSFFAFGEHLYFKARGVYLRLGYQREDQSIIASVLLMPDREPDPAVLYTPVIAINRSADGSRSAAYQPENRLNPDCTVWFDIDDHSLTYTLPVHGCRVRSIALEDEETSDFQTPPGGSDRVGMVAGRYVTLLEETLPESSAAYTRLQFDTPLFADEAGWSARDHSTEESRGGSYLKNVVYSSFTLPAPDTGVLVPPTEGDAAAAALDRYGSYARLALYRARRDYGEDLLSGRYLIAASGDYVAVYLECAGGMRVTDYNPATTEFRAVGWILQGIRLSAAAERDGTVTAAALSNRLRVTYARCGTEAELALKAIADCSLTQPLGGDDICVVMAGSTAQPNAIFWSGNGSSGVDPTYFPMDQYNLCGSYHDPVTGFGLQQGSLVIFQEHSLGKAAYSVQTLPGGGRKFIDLTYRMVNARIGCDLPETITLCGNRLVWADRRHGVLQLQSTTAAGENTVRCLSEALQLQGLFSVSELPEQMPGANGTTRSKQLYLAEGACATADRGKYYLFTPGKLLIWDFGSAEGTETERPCWTLHTLSATPPRAVLAPGNAENTENTENTVYLLCGITAENEASETEPKTGLLVLTDRAENDCGTPIRCRYTSPLLLPGGQVTHRQVLRQIWLRGGAGKAERQSPLLLTISTGGCGAPADGVQHLLEWPSGEGEECLPIGLRCRVRSRNGFQLTLEGEGLKLRSIELVTEELRT